MIEEKNINEPQKHKLNISDVIARLSKMIDEFDNKIQNIEYNTIFNKECDEDDLRCLKRTMGIFQDLNV